MNLFDSLWNIVNYWKNSESSKVDSCEGVAFSILLTDVKFLMKDILVIHDDIDLLFGNYRFKFNSSSGGHNGIKSIILRNAFRNASRQDIASTLFRQSCHAC